MSSKQKKNLVTSSIISIVVLSLVLFFVTGKAFLPAQTGEENTQPPSARIISENTTEIIANRNS